MVFVGYASHGQVDSSVFRILVLEVVDVDGWDTSVIIYFCVA